jgi:hypothetical protein
MLLVIVVWCLIAHVPPSFATNDCTSDRIGHSEVASKLAVADAVNSMSPTHFLNLVVVQFDHPAFFNSSWLPTLGNHVSEVVGAGSEKQMIDIHARRIVAAMQDKQAFWNRASRQFPSEPMRRQTFFFIVRHNHDDTVAAAIRFSCPRNTAPLRYWADSVFQSGLKGECACTSPAGRGTEASGCTWVDAERRATDFAITIGLCKIVVHACLRERFVMQERRCVNHRCSIILPDSSGGSKCF